MIEVINKTISIKSFTLSCGEASGDLAVECCLWGDANKPLLVIMGGISANRWALDCGHQVGWWNQVIQSNKHLNYKDYQYLTFEYFCFADRVTNPPVITTTDQAYLLQRIKEACSLPQFHAVIGSSYGGMVSLAFAANYPHSLDRLICIAAADKNSVKSQALRQIQRQIMALGEQFAHDSNEHKSFISLARALAMVGYRGEEEWEQRFQNRSPGLTLTAVTSYLTYQGDRFAEKFSSSRYCQLSQSIDFHQVDVSTIEADTLLIGVTSDQMVPVDYIQKMSKKFTSACQTHFIDSIHGHDGFLLEAEQIDAIFQTFFREYKHDNIQRNSRSASRN
ncbi:alpha/beta fold hydrolase [Marinicella litoralis]|uniref:Homoserine O-acetyltransferase n=1 Tax=Marinicella litoralis TaxID=644220 RepID=A0A4R6XT59_9GAMM|nr:alpha/beta fold hydrolase [Marinicella litoralis]TDR19548.1 homoserine O-acetyltransferase [Marinicella litoralis]